VQASDEDNSIVLQNKAETIVAYSDPVVLVATFELFQILDVLECGDLLNLCYGLSNAFLQRTVSKSFYIFQETLFE